MAGDRGDDLTVHAEGGDDEPLPVAHFFRGPPEHEPWERLALSACGARVLDLGAGAGSHALALQQAGRAVVAVDACPGAVQVMRARGVRDARRGELADVVEHVGVPSSLGAVEHAAELGVPFDSVLMLDHGAGLAGELDGLWALLDALPRLLAPGGCLLLDSADPSGAADSDVQPNGWVGPGCDPLPPGLASQVAVAELTLSWRGERGAVFPWLYLGERAMAWLVARAGLGWECLWLDGAGRWLGRVSVPAASTPRSW